MNHPEKQLKYSIRKVSVGAASVVIGALYLLMGAGVAHAEGMDSTREAERTAKPTDPERSGNGEAGNKPDLSNTDAAASTYSAPVAENPLVTPESTKPRTRSKRELPDGGTGETPAGNTGTESGDNQPTGENSPVLDANRKGEIVKTDQPGVSVPKEGQEGADDKNANLKFEDPGENATVEYMYKVIQNMPDDFQNNERSYLRNMNTLGDALRFDEHGNVTKDGSGKQLQDGEIREINEFGGWRAITKDGKQGTFAIGKKNAQGYFTGWYYKKGSTTEKEQGGMLGSNALDEIYVHEQALDRRFNYMLMLAKGRTRANRTDKAQDNTEYNPKTANRDENQDNLANLPVKERDDELQHSPNVEGFNGMEKTFTAFSTKYGSRLRIDFVTGYISDFEGSKGTYRIVVTALKKGETDNATKEETIYDHTINRIDGVVENEERYSQGVDLSAVNTEIKKILKDEYTKKIIELAKDRYIEKNPGTNRNRIKAAQYNPLKPIIEKELAEKGEAIVELPIDRDKLQEVKNKFKEELNFDSKTSYTTVANKLNGVLKGTLTSELLAESPMWTNTAADKNEDGIPKSKDPDRVYKLLDFILPTAKKIIYHGDTDQLELVTDPVKVKTHRAELKAKLTEKEALLQTTTDETQKTKLKQEISGLKSAIGSTNAYTYMEARNGKEAKILGSHMEATEKPDRSVLTEDEYEKIRTNDLALKAENGSKQFTRYFVETDKVSRDNVISDEKLSEEITKKIDGDKENLGKGGYFSTGDIPLDKDVIAYKIQVFAENKKRVGVNTQSPRLQYNLPILADFSVIQDTVEPSKEVAKRIIDKQVKEKKIPPEEGERLKGKIDESKKTSEVRKAISGNVKVRYVDENGQDIPLSDEEAKKVGEKSDNGTYLVEKEALIGSSYDVTSKKLRGINTGEKKYRLKRSLKDGLDKDSAAVTGSVTSADKIVTFVYEEGEATKAKAVVHVKKQSADNSLTELPEHKLNLETEVGEDFPSESVNNKVKELQKLGYEIIGNTFTNGTAESRKGDDKEDLDGQEPTQSYTITVQERTKKVTEPPTPNTPIDPENPNGPKWTEELVNQLSLKKDVTRTITYVKKDTPNGEEIPNAKPTVTQTAHFKRNVKVNVATGTVVEYTDWTSTDNNLAEVRTEKLDGYVANKLSVASVTVTETSNDLVEKVIYTKLGAWIPKIPKGVVPPEGTDTDPKPYPNHPTDPTKPGDPTDPNVPVIPYLPGYTPKIGETPLQPKVPGDPTKGYIPPAVPTDPNTNTDISYTADPQRAVVKVVNVKKGKEIPLPNDTVAIDNGSTDADIPKDGVNKKIADLEKRGYVVENKDLLDNQKFDTVKDPDDGDPTQVFTLRVHEKVVPVTPPTPDKPIEPGTPIDPTTPVDPDKPNDPTIPRWTEDLVKQLDTKKEVTRTITYVDEEGAKVTYTANGQKTTDAVTDKVTFTRTAFINVVTKTITYGEWTAVDNDTTFDAVLSPMVKGYVLKANQDTQGGLVEASGASVVASEHLKADSANQELKVVYRKLGAWIPKVPGVETPTPLPYPNHPTDPTKPGDPRDPKVPDVPVIPYVPGYTPKIGETPLQPKVPGDPTKGYIPPTVPTEPGTDTEITYVPDPQRALVKVYNVKDGVKIPLENDTVGINDGKTDQAIPTKSLEDKIKELEERGYTVDNKDLLKGKVFDNQKDPENGDPTQVYDLLVRERISLDTETKAVIRTIKYVRIEEQNGEEVEVENAQPTKTQTVNFSRDISINLATGRISNGKWSEKQTLGEVKTPVLEGYLADKAKVESREVTGDSESFEEKVIYRKIGSWVPKVPGKEEPTPIPYPNDPDDPTKPKTPDYPTTPPQPGQPVPKVPAIPYVPGYTPKIPNGTPLVPIDPEHPEKGYKVPPVPETPNDPKMDTPITYEGNPQKILIKVVNVTTGVEVPLDNEKLEFNGKSGETVKESDKNSVDDKITSLRNRGYIVDTVNPITATTKYDTESDDGKQEPTQTYKLVVREKISIDKESTTVIRTIKYVKIDVQDGNEVRTELNTEKIKTKVDKVEFSRDTTTNLTTGLTKIGTWDTETKELSKVNTPVLDGYLASVASVENKSVSPDTESYEVTVVYRKIGSWVPKVPGKEEPTPIPYPNDPDDPTKPKNPEYPETPGGNETPGTPTDPNKPTPPVIPYVPGYTPMVPTDPTKPVNPNTNPLKPLVPVDPEHPEKGYKVPPVPETPNDPKMDTPIEYTPDGQRAIIKFVVVGEDGKETELETSRITVTGKTGEKIPTENFNDTLKKLTGDPVNNGDYELVENPLKDGAIFDKVKDEEGKDPSQIFTVKLRQIDVLPPTPRIVERPSGSTVEVGVPNKDADTLIIKYTDRGKSETDPKKEIITKKDKDGSWRIEKAPDGVTINPTNGLVYIPSKQIEPKTWVDTQTKHKYKFSKIVSVMPTISDVKDFKGLTEWIDVNGHVLRPTEDGFHEKGRIANHVWLESRLEGNKITHIFFAGSPSVDKPEYKITVWFDKDGNPLKPDQPGTHEAGNIPGYRFIKTTTKDGITIHRFEKIPPVLPNEPIPDRPEEPRPQPNPEHPSVPTPSPELPNQETPIPEPETPRAETPVNPDPEVPTDETGKREELPNTGTKANAGLAGAGLLTLLAGLGLGFFKKKEDESE